MKFQKVKNWAYHNITNIKLLIVYHFLKTTVSAEISIIPII